MKFGVKVLILFILLSLILMGFDHFRSVYYLSDGKYITVWKRLGNKCYIIPGKYYGILKPLNYIETTNDNALTIIYDGASEYDYVISNDYGKDVKINSLDQKIKYFEYSEKDVFVKEYYTNKRIKNGLKYLQIDIKENLVIINGVKQ